MDPEPFGDIPLFREIQRLLASSGSGPINLEIAHQVANAVATEGRAEEPITDEIRKVLSDAIHSSESVLAGYTRLSLVEPITGEALTRAGWATKTLSAWRWLLERLAARFIDESAAATPEEAAGQMTMVMKQVGPLLMGLQAGTLVGQLAREVVSGFDPSIPREGEDSIILVIPNVFAIASGYDLDPAAVARVVAVQDVARHLVIQGVGWVAPYRKNLMTTLVDTIEIDTDELQRRLMDLQSQGMEALQEGQMEASLPMVPTPTHQAALDRVRAFVGLHEGYAAHATAAIAPQVLGDIARVDEAISRHRVAASEAKDMLASVLGFALDRDLAATGTTFCAAIERLEGLAALNQVWEAPDNLPTFAELKDPFIWIDRVIKEA